LTRAGLIGQTVYRRIKMKAKLIVSPLYQLVNLPYLVAQCVCIRGVFICLMYDAKAVDGTHPVDPSIRPLRSCCPCVREYCRAERRDKAHRRTLLLSRWSSAIDLTLCRGLQSEFGLIRQANIKLDS
jgi:hypothetical protein